MQRLTFLFFIFLFFFITLQTTGSYTLILPFGLLISIGFPWFISYSKWANDNIWNTKTSKPTNESIDPTNPTNPNDDNQQVLDNIENVLNTSNGILFCKKLKN